MGRQPKISSNAILTVRPDWLRPEPFDHDAPSRTRVGRHDAHHGPCAKQFSVSNMFNQRTCLDARWNSRSCVDRYASGADRVSYRTLADWVDSSSGATQIRGASSRWSSARSRIRWKEPASVPLLCCEKSRWHRRQPPARAGAIRRFCMIDRLLFWSP